MILLREYTTEKHTQHSLAKLQFHINGHAVRDCVPRYQRDTSSVSSDVTLPPTVFCNIVAAAVVVPTVGEL